MSMDRRRSMWHAASMCAALVAGSQTSRAVESAAPKPLTTLPYTPALDPSAMSRDIDPCTDFYAYSCGGWQKNNPIPPDQSSWEVYSKLEIQNLQYLWDLLLKAGDGAAANRSVAQRLSGDFFAACMDEPAIESRGLAPLKPMLAQIDALDSKRRLPGLLAALHRDGQDGFIFDFNSAQDPDDSNAEIAALNSGGIGLPERDYYFKRDAKSVEIRAHYSTHVEKMLRLVGEDEKAAARDAHAVMRLETALAAATLTLVDKRDPHQVNHRIRAIELARLTPDFSWPEYFKAVAADDHRIPADYVLINATEPAFLRAAGRLLQAASIASLKAYLRWHWVNASATLLPHSVADEHFDFYRHYLRGIEQPPPRWKTCVLQVDNQIGEALGRLFIEKTFAPATKRQALDMLSGIQAAMKQRIESLDWMGPATKANALKKLASMRTKIGYPERWRDYSGLSIDRNDYFGDVTRSEMFERYRQLAKIGRPVDRDEWQMTTPTVNAYYDWQMNDINFPAAVLQPPLFDTRIDMAPSWGNTGATMGHELTHGFDDEGRQYDDKGNLHDWWTHRDAAEFKTRAQCVVVQYSAYTAVDDIKVNGRLTLGENIADLGGTILAYVGWKAATAQTTLKEADGLSPDQRFFVGMAQWACGSDKPEIVRLRAATDQHAPLRDRINGVVVNMPEFAKAFSCKAGLPMVKDPARICRIW
jgi:putative endopeptidase